MWYFKGRRKKYKSPYTGKEVDAAVKKAEDTTATAEEIDAAVELVNSLEAPPEAIDVAAEFVGRMGVTSENVEEAVQVFSAATEYAYGLQETGAEVSEIATAAEYVGELDYTASEINEIAEKVEGYPNPVSTDVGKVFTIDSDGGVILDTPQSGGGDALYYHSIKISPSSGSTLGTDIPKFGFYSHSNTPFTLGEISKWLYDNGFTSNIHTICLPMLFDANTVTVDGGYVMMRTLRGIYSSNGTTFKICFGKQYWKWTYNNGSLTPSVSNLNSEYEQTTSITPNGTYDVIPLIGDANGSVSS